MVYVHQIIQPSSNEPKSKEDYKYYVLSIFSSSKY